MTSPRSVFPHLTVLFEQKEAQPREVQLLHYEDWKGDIAGSVQDLVQLVDIVLSTTPPPGQDSPPVVVQCRWVGKPMLALQKIFSFFRAAFGTAMLSELQMFRVVALLRLLSNYVSIRSVLLLYYVT